MFSFKKSLAALAGLALIIGLIALFNPANTQGQGNSGNAPPAKDVNVVNTPLPVTGTVNIGNLGDAPLPVRDVDNPARQPFQARLCMVGSNASCTGNIAFPNSVAVPAGKRLVIEQIAGECFPSGSTLAVGLTVTTNSTTVTHLFGITYPIPDTTGYTNHTTRLYADGGTTIVPANNSLVPSNVACDIAFSGYLFTP